MVVIVPDTVNVSQVFQVRIRQFFGGCERVVSPEVRESASGHDIHLRVLIDRPPLESGEEYYLCPDVEYSVDHSVSLAATMQPGVHRVVVYGVADGEPIEVERRVTVR